MCPYIGGRSVVRVHLGLGHFSDTTKFAFIWKTDKVRVVICHLNMSINALMNSEVSLNG